MVRAVLSLLALGAILYYLLIIIPEQRTRQEGTARDSQLKNDARSKSKTPLIGDQVILDGSGDLVMLATRKSDYAAVADAWIVRDQARLRQMEASGRLILVPGGTKALLIDASLGTANVKILDGRMPGRSGWVPIERIRKP